MAPKVAAPIDFSLGNQKFGPTLVDCKFLAEEQHWGILQKLRSAIIHLHLTISEQPGYKLREVVINLCLIADKLYKPPTIKMVYPGYMCGGPRFRKVVKDRSLLPNFKFAGVVSVGNVGGKNRSEATEGLRWHFQGVPIADEETNNYHQARWSWQANALNSQSEEKNDFRLAVVPYHIEHSFETVMTIQGKMQSGWRRFRFWYSGGVEKKIKIPPRFDDSRDLEPVLKSLKEEIDRMNTAHIMGRLKTHSQRNNQSSIIRAEAKPWP